MCVGSVILCVTFYLLVVLADDGRNGLGNGQALALDGLMAALVVLDAVKGAHWECKLPIDHGMVVGAVHGFSIWLMVAWLMAGGSGCVALLDTVKFAIRRCQFGQLLVQQFNVFLHLVVRNIQRISNGLACIERIASFIYMRRGWEGDS